MGGTFVSDGTLTSLIAEVRDAIGDEARHSRFIRTVHRFGYSFSGDVREVRPGAGNRRQKLSCWLLRGRRRILIEAGETVIGRDPGASCPLTTTAFAPTCPHRPHEEGATLEDLGSKNGTFLSGARSQRQCPWRTRQGQSRAVPLTVRIFEGPESTDTAENEPVGGTVRPLRGDRATWGGRNGEVYRARDTVSIARWRSRCSPRSSRPTRPA